jgi:manganese/zinc/iron transport system permease protein
MISYNTLIVLLGTSLLGASSGLVGTFAVLRRRSLTGDALAHASLPGLCLAFLVLERRSLPAMLAGAFITGILGVTAISALRRWTRIKEDAALGTVAFVFFGAGLVLSRLIQNRTTTGSKAGLDSYIFGKTAGMIAQDVYLIAGLSSVCLLIILLLYKEFKLTAFDPGFARVQGWPAFLLDLLLMTLIAIAVVIGLPAVGVVLIAALLILPGAAARFWTESLGTMLGLSVVFGFGIGIVGTLISASMSLLPAGPIIVLVGSTLFVFSMLCAPRRGALVRAWRERQFRDQLARERLQRRIYEVIEPELPERRTIAAAELRGKSQSPAARVDRALDQLVMSGELVPAPGGYRLTPHGLRKAAAVTRDHRLWELLLTENTEFVGDVNTLDRLSLATSLPPAVFEALEQRLVLSGRAPWSGDDGLDDGKGA